MSKSSQRPNVLTYELISCAADRLSSTVVATDAKDGNGVTIETEESTKVDGNTKQTRRGGAGVVGGLLSVA